MFRSKMIFSLLLFNMVTIQLIEAADPPEPCGLSPHSMRIGVRHIEANGIGYNQGYSTLEGFFAPFELWKENWMPFLDLRGHAFNNGKPAVNAGLGLRYLASRIWGINAYYDYRKTSRQHYNQVSVGLESLGEFWDFRINGYLPVGDKKSHFFSTRFIGFEEHSMIISCKREFAMKGANAEVGLHVDKIKNAPLYFAAGPYYLTGGGKTAWGGEVRAALDLFKYVRIEGNTSYDKVFKWIGQGQVGLVFSFGEKKTVKQRTGHACSTDLALRDRIFQRVNRNEIIPVDSKRNRSEAINPHTGEPFFVWFVNNTSLGGDGSFANPFNTLIAAQNASSPNDIIYVFRGDGTTQGMDAGITLQDNQQFLGTGVTYTFPSQCESFGVFDPGTPQITNLAGNAVNLANNNVVEGFAIISPSGVGIQGLGISNVLIQHNFISNPGAIGGIFLQNSTGTLNIVQNAISIPLSATLTNGAGIDIENRGTTTSIVNVIENAITTNFQGIEVFSFDTSFITSNILRNSVTGVTGAFTGIDVSAFNASTQKTLIDRNAVISINAPGGIGIDVVSSRFSLTPPVTFTFIESIVTNNAVSGSDHEGIAIATTNGGRQSSSVADNVMLNNGAGIGFRAQTSSSPGGDVLCLQLINNVSDTGFTLINFPGDTFTNTFNLEPLQGNIGTVTTIGVITPVPTCQ